MCRTDPNGAAIYGDMDPIKKYPKYMLALIYQHHGSVMGCARVNAQQRHISCGCHVSYRGEVSQDQAIDHSHVYPSDFPSV